MTITPEINPDTGLTVYAWQVGESGGYAATPEEAINDALRCDNGQLKSDNARLREALTAVLRYCVTVEGMPDSDKGRTPHQACAMKQARQALA